MTGRFSDATGYENAMNGCGAVEDLATVSGVAYGRHFQKMLFSGSVGMASIADLFIRE